ncbi:MAG TPA: serine/threonine-protein kinase [Kofleriaceae bacterium]|nr:serine/threonine-protein kinase [Kofleriaceae bacterium]
MQQPDVIARALSRTRGAPTGEHTSDEVREFLQKRVAGFGLVIACVFGLFLVWRSVAIVVESQVQGHRADLSALPALAGEVGFFLAVWLYCRRRPRSMRTLLAIDVGATLIGCAAVSLMPYRIPYHVRPDYIALLALTYVVMIRAIFIPSTARRTALIAIAVAPVLLVNMFFAHQGGHNPADYTAAVHEMVHDSPRAWAVRWTVIDAVWWTAATVVSTLTSHVFYGLRKEVSDARRLGQYTLHEVLGQGGMGTVYRASHALLRRPTAVKLLPPENIGEESVLRFEREVQLTARLTHPNTVRIFDYGRTAERVFYYAMEYLDGASLDRVVKVGGAMPAARVIHILQQVAGALAEAHGIGLIHRDIKPANILLTEQGGIPDVAKILDFGLVKEIGGTSEDGATVSPLTRSDSIAGTPQYMSPEAISTPHKVDARTDIYALGAVAYFLVSGVEVFKGRTTVEICSHHLHTEPLPPGQRVDRTTTQPVPRDLEALILRCLAKMPSARPGSARALRAELDALADAGRWTEEDARAWWSQHGATLRQAATPDKPPTGSEATLEIDLGRRSEAELVTVRERRVS